MEHNVGTLSAFECTLISSIVSYQRYTPKLTNIAELKDCFVDDAK